MPELTLHRVVHTIRGMRKFPILNNINGSTEVTTIVLDNGNAADIILIIIYSLYFLDIYRELLIVRSNITNVRNALVRQYI